MNTITINFIECNPAPANGYNLQWRVAGSGDPYTDEGNFSSTPIVFTDDTNPAGTCYEGFLQSDCSESGESGSVLGNQIPWSTPCESGGTSYTIELSSPCVAGVPNSTYNISGGTPGDVITVRASFGGIIQKVGVYANTRADLLIFSPDGTSDSASSACYSDSASHGFSITADTIITMVGTTTIVSLSAVVNNSSEAITNVQVTIVDVNGEPHNVFVIGCRGNSGGPITC